MKELNVVLSHVRKAYARPVLTDVNLEITNDSYTAVVGRSGSGKSTLLNILGLVEDRDGGGFVFNGKKITADFAGFGLVKGQAGADEVSAVTGASKSSTAVTNAVNAAVKWYQARGLKGGEQ